MTQAVTAGGTAGGENIAYVQTLLGNLLVNQGRLNEAAMAYVGRRAIIPRIPRSSGGPGACPRQRRPLRRGGQAA